jgi:glycosyltransferase involved in cell wall biosynthesis
MRAHLTEHLELTNVEWIPNGVSTSDTKPDASASRDCVVLAAGHYYRRKRFEELVECWPGVVRRVPHARLAIVTNAPQSLRSLVTRSAVASSISLQPLLPATQLHRMMAAATLFALPSTAEAFGLVYAEALSVGTPVLTSTDCGLAALVSSPDAPLGWVSDAKDPASLTRSIVGAIESPDECRRRGLSGSRVVRERFTWQANAYAVLNAFGRLGARA